MYKCMGLSLMVNAMYVQGFISFRLVSHLKDVHFSYLVPELSSGFSIGSQHSIISIHVVELTFPFTFIRF